MTASGITLDNFQATLTDVSNQNGKDMTALIAQYGSFDAVMQSGEISASLITKTLSKMAAEGKVTADSVEGLGDKLSYFQKVVDDVWRGDYDNNNTAQLERFQKLEAAGYDYVKVQELVNSTVDGHRLTLEELCLIYNVQFPVLQQNEDDTWYDTCGNIVFTCSKGLVGVGVDRDHQLTNRLGSILNKCGEYNIHVIMLSQSLGAIPTAIVEAIKFKCCGKTSIDNSMLLMGSRISSKESELKNGYMYVRKETNKAGRDKLYKSSGNRRIISKELVM